MNDQPLRLGAVDLPGHPTLDQLADHAAGLPLQTQDTADHVGDCPHCSAVVRQLQGPADDVVRQQLTAAGAPPMPDAVRRQVAATVAGLNEPAPRGSADHGAPVGAAPTTVLPAARRSRRTALLGLAAALVGIVVLVGVGLGLSQRSPTTQSSTSAAAGSSVAGPSGPRLLSSGTDWDAATLRNRLPALLAGTLSTGHSSAGDAQGAVQGAALRACLAEVAGPGGPAALLVDDARYDDKPALVVVLPGSSPSKVDVYVVGTGCTTGDSQLLLYLSVAR